MTKFPFYPDQRSVDVGGSLVSIPAYTPVLFASVTAPDVVSFPADSPKFPVILDTGSTASLYIRREHLIACTRPSLDPNELPQGGRAARVRTSSGKSSPQRMVQARVWLHRFPEGPVGPLDLQVSRGILVHEGRPDPQADEDGPPYPLLGARAFQPTGLKVVVDYDKLEITLELPERDAEGGTN